MDLAKERSKIAGRIWCDQAFLGRQMEEECFSVIKQIVAHRDVAQVLLGMPFNNGLEASIQTLKLSVNTAQPSFEVVLDLVYHSVLSGLHYEELIMDYSKGCGKTTGHGESCVEGHLCGTCSKMSRGELHSIQVPCGQTTGHGECCCEGRLCSTCTTIKLRRGY